ncbi:WD repeat-containing protein 76-like [Adelges cooleyi]|uniref:WD repeat-containing protein 76-like n=1 Tax=Adelges cooleyi TaxID=133065 RepID=UPI00217FA6F2|nr:WD repeat-containing protein 76-like [Adelges cooleyi]XP_050435286.1 WD repeat-containing protein 76-like [Adelges cooleyi]XP_050435295.1 WD repeat-containing protein 76-like [Adelges cooleyi]
MLDQENEMMNSKNEDVTPPKVAKLHIMSMANSDDDTDDDENDENLTYEQLREKRMRENMDMFEFTGVNEAATALANTLKKLKPVNKITTKIVSKPTNTALPIRRSMRIARQSNPLETTKEDLDDTNHSYRLRSKHTSLLINEDENDSELNINDPVVISEEDSEFFEKLNSDLAIKEPVNDYHSCGIRRFTKVLKSLSINEMPMKVINDRIYSLAIHPSESSLIIAAGDRKGNIALFNQKETDAREYRVHHSPVNCLSFCSWDPYKLFSTSHDGSVRCGDIVKRTFDTIYTSNLWPSGSNKDSHVTWHSEYERNLLIGCGSGDVDLIDTRTPMKVQGRASCHQRSVRTVQSHPLEKHYYLTSSGVGEVLLMDVRKMTTEKVDPVLRFDHPRALTSAFFSATGINMVTTCNDDQLRIFDTSQLTTASEAVRTIPHDNHTGRWISVFKAKWQPGRDDTFFISSLLKPKRMQVYDSKGALLHALIADDVMTTYCPVIEVHPSQAIYVGGNASGKLHIFSTEKQLQ